MIGNTDELELKQQVWEDRAEESDDGDEGEDDGDYEAGDEGEEEVSAPARWLVAQQLWSQHSCWQ